MQRALGVLLLVLSGPGCAAARPPSPRAAACTLTAAQWPQESFEDGRGANTYLRFVVGGAPFARVFAGTDVRLELQPGLASAGGALSLDALGVRVRGHLEAPEMPLYPAKVFAMSDMFVPNGDRRLLLRSARPGFVTLAAPPLHRVDTLSRELVAERPCSEVSLVPQPLAELDFERLWQAPAASEPTAPWPWLRDGKLLLTTTTDVAAPAVVVEAYERDDTLLLHPPRLLERRAGHTRIALHTFGGVLFGWVTNESLITSTAEYMDVSHDADIVLEPAPAPPGRVWSCARETPLLAEITGERREIGTIAAGTRFVRTKSGIAFLRPGVVAARGASFWLRNTDLTDCSEAPR